MRTTLRATEPTKSAAPVAFSDSDLEKHHNGGATESSDTDGKSYEVNGGIPEIDHVAEKKLIRKLDLMIIPPVMLRESSPKLVPGLPDHGCSILKPCLGFIRHLVSPIQVLSTDNKAVYLFSFLDRVNIGNARLYGLEDDLGMHGSQYQTAVSLLFVTYILCELPSNLVIKKLRPSRWLAFITTSWGIVATLTGVVQSYGGFIACRLILGALEAGLFPGLAIYLTLFYTKRELALRVGYLFVSAAISGSVGGLLAYGIGHMDGVAGQRGWRWIMIIEGLPTFVLGIAVYWWLADDPETAYYLTDEERRLGLIRKERQIGWSRTGDTLTKGDVYKGLQDWKIWAFAVGQFGVDTMLYGYSTFLPTIIKSLGDWSTAEVQALTIPCYALGAITYLTVAYFSDKYQQRAIPAVIAGVISIIGYGILIADVSSGVHYFACFLIAFGKFRISCPLACLTSPRLIRCRWYSTGVAPYQSAQVREANNGRRYAAHYWKCIWYRSPFPIQDQ